MNDEEMIGMAINGGLGATPGWKYPVMLMMPG